MAFQLPSRDDAPHKAVIFLRAEVHETLPTGECSGRPVYKIDQFPLVVEGEDKFICVRKLNELIEELKQRCRCQR